jgi:hypothetical protein
LDIFTRQADARLTPISTPGTGIEKDDPVDVPINPVGRLSEKDYLETPVIRAVHREDTVTRLIEQQTAKIPSNYFLMFGLASMAASLLFELAGQDKVSRFVGMWPAPVLLLGIYNKIVKMNSFSADRS